eukprot:CFRG7591T1
MEEPASPAFEHSRSRNYVASENALGSYQVFMQRNNHILSADQEIATLEWRWYAFRGVVAVLFSLITFLAPGITLNVFLYLFSASLTVQGVFSIAFGLYVCNGWVFFSGLFDVAVGVLSFVYQEITALSLLYMVAFRMLFFGVYFVAYAWLSLSSQIPREITIALGTNGVFFMLGGISLLGLHPAEGIIVLLWIVALQAMLDGFHSILIARGVYRLANSHYAPIPTLETA